MRHVITIVMDRAITIGLAVVVTLGLLVASGALRPLDPAPAPTIVLDSNTLIVVRTETPEGEEVAPPVTMKLWEYVTLPDRENAADLSAFETAFEADLANRDTTFHLTHENIDGRRW